MGGFYGDEMIDLLPDAPVPGTKLSHELDAYTGEYRNPGYGKIVIEKDDGLKGIPRHGAADDSLPLRYFKMSYKDGHHGGRRACHILHRSL